MPGDGAPLTTPDGRYIVVKGRLWRASNPALADDVRERLVKDLMEARRAVGQAQTGSDDMKEARRRVNEAKISLGERGPVWWADGVVDMNRKLVENTPYANWYEKCCQSSPPREPSSGTEYS